MAEIKIEQQRKFTRQTDYAASAVIRVCNIQVPGLGRRDTWVTLANASGKRVYRRIRGDKNLPANAIELDYDTSLELAIPQAAVNAAGFYPCLLTMAPSSRLEILLAHWSHPDHNYRAPMQLGLISLFLGVVGLFLGVLSLR